MNTMNFVCIDNNAVRKRLLASQTFSIQTVPCVVIVYAGGRVEKIESENIIDWFMERLGGVDEPPIHKEELQQHEPEPVQDHTLCLSFGLLDFLYMRASLDTYHFMITYSELNGLFGSE